MQGHTELQIAKPMVTHSKASTFSQVKKRSLNKTDRDISSISVLAEEYTAKKMIGLLLKDSQSSWSLLLLAGNQTLSVSDLHRIRFAVKTCRSLLHCIVEV